MFRLVAVPCLALTLLFGSGCELTNTVDDTEDDLSKVAVINYSRHVQPLLDTKCGACHGSGVSEGGLDLSTWQAAIAGSDNGEAFIPLDADHSLMIELEEKLGGGGHLANVGADSLTTIELNFLKRWIDEGAKGPGDVTPYGSASDELLYVANQGDATISIIAIGPNVVARRVDLQDYGFSATSRPHHVAVEPDGSHWYVSLIGDNIVAKFDRENNLVGQATFERPGMLAVHPSRDMLFVGRSLTSVNPPSSVGIVTRSTMAIEEIDVFFARPHALIVDGSGDYVMSASLDENQIITIALADTSVTFTFVSSPSTLGFVQHAASSNNPRIFVSAPGHTGEIISYDATDPRALSDEMRVPIPGSPWHPVFSPDGDKVYAGNLADNSVAVLNGRTVGIDKFIVGNGLSQPHGSATSADGRYLYISNRNTGGDYTPRFDLGDNAGVGTIVVIDTQTETIVKVIEVGTTATGLGVSAR